MKIGDLVIVHYPLIDRKFLGVFYSNSHDRASCFVYLLLATRSSRECVSLNNIRPVGCKWLNRKYKIAIEAVKDGRL